MTHLLINNRHQRNYSNIKQITTKANPGDEKRKKKINKVTKKDRKKERQKIKRKQ